jgi:hypothetical protein
MLLPAKKVLSLPDIHHSTKFVDLDNVENVETRYGLDGPGTEFLLRQGFQHSFRTTFRKIGTGFLSRG